MCMTPCERFRNNIFDLVDDELDVHQKHELEKHLKLCASCSIFLSQCRQLRKRLQTLPRLAASETFHLLLRERIRRELAGKRRTSSPLFFSAPRRWIPAIAVALLLIAIGILLRDQKQIMFQSPQTRIADTNEAGERVKENVRYVIDEYPGGVSLSRDDSKRTPTAVRDSLLLQQETQRVRPHLTPVSF
jgi:anti-sigma factor RsiW